MNTTSIPSIGSSAMLTTFKASVWAGRKLDKRASQDVEDRNNAVPQMANVHKKLLGNCEQLIAIQKHVSNTRTSHNAETLAWEDNGSRLITTAAFFNYTHMMSGAETLFWKLHEKFLSTYASAQRNAEMYLGDLFNKSDYPSEEVLRDKFKWSLVQAPIPQSGDFRLDIQNDAMEELKLQYEQNLEAKIKGANDDMLTRLQKALKNMSAKLDYGDHEDKKVFRDTLVSNVTDCIDMLSNFNITNDLKLHTARDQLEYATQGVTADALREDAHFRAQTKKNVDDILKSLPSIGI